ncbi:MAG: GH32 C-terminal domain-containing protein, partial [Propionibacteriaceae bacterium]|nr:GH32 C-terminal domain-containing protein [Propionibacteriaceae bacterium]
MSIKRGRLAALAISAALVAALLPITAPATPAGAQTPTGFTSRSGGTVTESGGAVTVSQLGGDHFVSWDASPIVKGFLFESDVQLAPGSRSAALLFGLSNPSDPGAGTWYGANFDSGEGASTKIRVFRVNSYTVLASAGQGNVDFTQLLHLKLLVNPNGSFTYTIGNVGAPASDFVTLTGTDSSYAGGALGLLAFQSEATYTNLNYEPWLGGPVHTNITDQVLDYSGTWTRTDDGLRGAGGGDNFLRFNTTATDFVYGADVHFNTNTTGAAALMFRENGGGNNRSYIANIHPQLGYGRLFRFGYNGAQDLVAQFAIPTKTDYHLEVTVIGKHIVYKVDGEIVVNTADYTGNSVNGQGNIDYSGRLGFLVYDADVTHQNIYWYPVTAANAPLLTALDVTPVAPGTAEPPSTFIATQPNYIQYVDFFTGQATINAPTANPGTTVTITGPDGNPAANPVSLSIGQNLFKVDAVNPDGAAMRYSLNIIRRGYELDYYNEPYRNQTHYSVPEGWNNDPNGLVYFQGKYHFFQQFYTATVWGPMHWSHATSTDLVHWDWQPIAFYPDEYGTMFSGSAVVADNTTAPGIFGPGEEGIVTFITADGNGERVILGKSLDGVTFEKIDGVVLDWWGGQDPFNNGGFRDPKVFRYQNKWFLIIAGGPVRIYSSNDLVNWQPEGMPGWDTECPDLVLLPVKDSTGTVVDYKWLLSRGGVSYKVGDFAVDGSGKWNFLPDPQYTGNDNAPFYLTDSNAYAGMTYSQGEFTESSANPRVVWIQWMNGAAYPSAVGDPLTNTRFNGTFSLQTELSLTADPSGRLVLVQTPISEYQSLRQTPTTLNSVTLTPGGENPLADFEGDVYEIDATFTPSASATAFGFNVRQGADGQQTSVRYNWADKKLTVDRSKGGRCPTLCGTFTGSSVIPGSTSVTMKVYVDRAAVEAFIDGDSLIGTYHVLHDADALGLEVFTEGGDTDVTLNVYPLKSIWYDPPPDPAIPTGIAIPAAIDGNDGSVKTILATLTPATAADPGDLVWTVADPSVAHITGSGLEADILGLAPGTTTITVTSPSKPWLQATATLTVRGPDNFATNLTGYHTGSNGGHYYIDDTILYGVGGSNPFYFAAEESDDKYVFSADVKKGSDLVNLIFQSQGEWPYDGSYAVQLRNGSTGVRLFDFLNDYTFATAPITVSNTQTYHVDIVLNGARIQVYLDQALAIDYTVTDPARIYPTGLFALCAHNTPAEFSNVFWTPAPKLKGKVVDA